MGVRLQRVWTRDEVRDDLRAALDVVAELSPPDDLRGAVFSAAVQALMQRTMEQVGAGLGAMAMPRGMP